MKMEKNKNIKSEKQEFLFYRICLALGTLSYSFSLQGFPSHSLFINFTAKKISVFGYSHLFLNPLIFANITFLQALLILK